MSYKYFIWVYHVWIDLYNFFFKKNRSLGTFLIVYLSSIYHFKFKKVFTIF